MSFITVGIELAKNVFAVHGVDDNGKAALVRPKVARDKLLELVAQLPPCGELQDSRPTAAARVRDTDGCGSWRGR